MSSYELSPGVVIDTERGEAYVMSPQGGIVAVELSNGERVWHSHDADKPLMVSGDLLLGQAEMPGPQNELRIVSLRTEDGGAPVRESLVQLPGGVQPEIARAPNRAFSVSAHVIEGDAAVSWEFSENPLRGISNEAAEVLPDEEGVSTGPSSGNAPVFGPIGAVPPPSETTVLRGAVRLSLSDGSVEPMVAPHSEMAPGNAPVGSPQPPPGTADANVLSGISQPQFVSNSGGHVMTSKLDGDDSVWDKYVWTIYDRTNGEAVGELRTHVRYAPFIVVGGEVIFESQPHVRREGGELIEEPLQIGAYELATGAVKWRHPVRDIQDVGPPPP